MKIVWTTLSIYFWRRYFLLLCLHFVLYHSLQWKFSSRIPMYYFYACVFCGQNGLFVCGCILPLEIKLRCQIITLVVMNLQFNLYFLYLVGIWVVNYLRSWEIKIASLFCRCNGQFSCNYIFIHVSRKNWFDHVSLMSLQIIFSCDDRFIRIG